MNNLEKIQIEQRVLASFDSTRFVNHSWFLEKPFQDFSVAWWDLQHYYQKTRDPVMSIVVLRTYIEKTEVLRGVWGSNLYEMEVRQGAKDALMSLGTAMNKILEAIVDYNPEDTEYDEKS